MRFTTIKKFTLYNLFILISIIVSSCDSGNQVSATFNGTVTKVHDGDSIHITPHGKKRVIIRLAAIDAPEVKQLHGIQSRDHLRSLILNKHVTANCNKLDKYKRQVCVVLLNGRDTNLDMLASGHAWYYERFKAEQSNRDQRKYKKAADSARKQKLGLWQSASAIAPWDYRASQRN